ncbi:unnamed protein product, partial [Dracunculus medinensis]|uniref:ZP domain-containing protein n=1 Tax=Dracunculus medinensis TaxID=318479 RepID=A0A0N4U3E0_DRAME
LILRILFYGYFTEFLHFLGKFSPNLYHCCIFKTIVLKFGNNLRYPNEIVDIPIVKCEQNKILLKVKTTISNPSNIYVDEFISDPDCSSRNLNYINIPLDKCGMTKEKTVNPTSIIYRICFSIQLHPLFATENDRSYCAQCIYLESDKIENLNRTLAISEAVAADLEPQFETRLSQPKCAYSIRRGSIDGPEIHYALLGETVFHVWKCSDVIEESIMLVQNCYVEDGERNRILIIDHNGCGVDHYVLPTPEYTADHRMAIQKTQVFKFAEKTITRFTCQIRLCLKDANLRISPFFDFFITYRQTRIFFMKKF